MADTQTIPSEAYWAQKTGAFMRETISEIEAAPAPVMIAAAKIDFAHFAQLGPDIIDDITNSGKIDRDRCIYVIGLDDEADDDEINEAFRYAKANLRFALPKHNKRSSRTLYVGSSCATGKRTNTLRTRLRQHLLGTSKVTSALSLAKWTSNLPGGISLTVWQYPSFGEGEEADRSARRVVLAVEDWLSHTLQPMLGRRGSQN